MTGAPPGRTPVRPGDTFEVQIEKGVYRGLGLARHEGQVVLVPRGLPGDRLRVRVDSAERGFLRARTEAVLTPAPGRRPSPCSYAERCGGCAYQELDYTEQLRLKEAVLRESLSRAAVAWDGPIPMAGSPEEGWRMRAALHLQRRGRELLLGLHEEGTHRVVDLPRCLQLSAGMTGAARALLEELRRHPRWAASIQHVGLAESLDGAHLVMSLETELGPREAVSLEPLGRRLPGLTGFGAEAGEGRGRRFLVLRGDPHVRSKVAGVELRAHVRSFFQSNRFLAGPLVATVLELTPPGGSVVDLYAGVGLFALPLARAAARVRAAEVNPMAAEDARWNAERATLSNVQMHRGDVSEALALWDVDTAERVVLDPPRTGAGPEVVRQVAAREPEAIVYVSCDPATLARDLKAFEAHGYRPDAVRAFDLFPDTFHLETVVRLRR